MTEKRKAVIVKNQETNEITLYSNLKKAYEANTNKIWIAYSTFIKEIAYEGKYKFGEIEIKKIEIH